MWAYIDLVSAVNGSVYFDLICTEAFTEGSNIYMPGFNA